MLWKHIPAVRVCSSLYKKANTCFLFKIWPCFRFQQIVAFKCSDVCGEVTIFITKVLNCFKVEADLIPRRKMCQLRGKVSWRLVNHKC